MNEKLVHDETPIERITDRTDAGQSLFRCLELGKLRLKDRKILQVLLAQSVLFFPWKGTTLNSRGIAVHKDHTRGTMPFASIKSDRRDSAMIIGTHISASVKAWTVYGHPVLIALAAVLLELEFRQPIDTLRNDEDLDKDELSTNFWTASRLLKDHQFDMHQGPHQAIAACVKCDFKTKGQLKLENEEIISQIHDKVVRPLEDELWNGFGIRLPLVDMSQDSLGEPSMKTTQHTVQRRKPEKTVQIAEPATV
jgi:hypothetical protein